MVRINLVEPRNPCTETTVTSHVSLLLLLLLLLFSCIWWETNQFLTSDPSIALTPTQTRLLLPRRAISEAEKEAEFYRDPKASIAKTRVAIEEAHERLKNGTLELSSPEEDIKTGDDLENVFYFRYGRSGTQTTLPPPYLNRLFQLAIDNHPKKDMAHLFRFRLTICLGTEIKCGGTYALPNGTIVVSYQSISQTRNEAELVGLMGHEITHVLERHTAKWDAFREYVDERGNKFAILSEPRLGRKVKLYYHLYDIDSQIRADLGGLTTVQNMGYDACAWLSFAKRRKIESERINAVASELKKSGGCNGSKFIIGNRTVFAAAKKDLLRNAPNGTLIVRLGAGSLSP